MASDNEASCVNDPNFAVICAFLEKFGVLCGVTGPDFMELQDMLENTNEVPPALIELHIKLLRKVRRSVSYDRWERVLIKVCHLYCTQDAWELERFGYKNARLTSKLRILKNLCEMQFDLNPKFKVEVNGKTPKELRSEPIGRDKFGHSYWYQIDENCQLRVYREDPDEETWALVARDREGLVRLIQQLSDGDVGELVLNEDSNSLEIEKPIIDTGQVSSSVSTCEAEVDADADADADGDADAESSMENEDSKESMTSELKTDESDNKVTESEHSPNDLKVTINKQHITPAKNENIEQTENASSFKGADVLTKKKKSIHELAENLTKHKSSDFPSHPIIQDQVQEQEMDLSMKKKPPLKVKHFASLSEPPIDDPLSDEDDEDDEDSYESDEIKLPSHMKQPRLGRPTLLGNAKKKPYSEEEDDEDEEDDDEYSEAIEEPVMLVRGEGSGRECKNENSNFGIEFSDVIEESVMFFYGEGSGHDCNTGNTAKEEGGDNATSSEKKETEEQSKRTLHCGSGDSGENIVSQSESVLDDSKTHKIGTVMIDVKSVDRQQVIPDVVQLKKVSRWDVGKPNEIEKPSTNISIKNEINAGKSLDVNMDSQSKETETKDVNLPKPLPVPPKQSMFFFGPQSDCFKFNTPISTHFQCTKSPSKISKTDDKPENASVNKTENVPSIEKKADILLVKEQKQSNPLNEKSTENTIDKTEGSKEKQNETVDSSGSTSSSISKPEETEDEKLENIQKNTTSISEDLTSDSNTKLDDDEKSETLSETLDSLETLIGKDDTIEDKEKIIKKDDAIKEKEKSIENTIEKKKKSQLPTLKSNSTENLENKDNKIVDDLNKPSISLVSEVQIKEETTKPVDKTQIDEVSSSDNNKIGANEKDSNKSEIPAIEKSIRSNVEETSSVLQETKTTSKSCVKDLAEQVPKEQSPSARVSICEPTTSENILPVESKPDLPITESTKTIESDSSIKSTLEEPKPIVQNKLNVEESTNNENTLPSSSDKPTEENLNETLVVIKTPVDSKINKEETSESIKISNESEITKIDDLKQSAIEDITEDISISKNESSTLKTNTEQDAIEHSTNKTEQITKLSEKNDELSVEAKDDVVVNEELAQTSQITETILENKGDVDKSAVIIETKDNAVINEDTVVCKEAKQTPQISETTENKDDSKKSAVEFEAEHDSVVKVEKTSQITETISESNDELNKGAVIIEAKKEEEKMPQVSETTESNDLNKSAVIIEEKEDPVVSEEVKQTLQISETTITEAKDAVVINEDFEQTPQKTENASDNNDNLHKNDVIIEAKDDAVVNQEVKETIQVSKTTITEAKDDTVETVSENNDLNNSAINKIANTVKEDSDDLTEVEDITKTNEDTIINKENMPEKDKVNVDNKIHFIENATESTLEHKPVENKTEIMLENLSDETNVENRSEIKIIEPSAEINFKTTNKIDNSLDKSETSNSVENVVLAVNSLETTSDTLNTTENNSEKSCIKIISDESNSCKVKKHDIVSTETTSEQKSLIIDSIAESVKIPEQIAVVKSIESCSTSTDTNLLENKSEKSFANEISKQNKLESVDESTKLLDLSSNSKRVVTNQIENSSIKIDLIKQDCIEKISQHNKLVDVENLKSISSNVVLNKECDNDNKKDVIEIIDKGNEIDDSQKIIEEKQVLPLKEELDSKEQPNIEDLSKKQSEHPKLVVEEKIREEEQVLPLKEELESKEQPNIQKENIEDLSKKQPEHSKLVLEEKVKKEELVNKEQLNSKNEKLKEILIKQPERPKLIVEDETQNKIEHITEKNIDETDKNSLQKTKEVIISSVQTLTNKEVEESKKPSISESCLPPSKSEMNDQIVPELANKPSVEELNQEKAKDIKSEVENISKEIIPAEVVESNQKIECQNSELTCNVESVNIVKDIKSIDKNIIKPPEIQIEKSIPEKLENADTAKQVDICIKSMEEPCIEEILDLSKTQASNIEEKENLILPNNESEILSKPEPKKDVDLTDTSVLQTTNEKVEPKERITTVFKNNEDISKKDKIDIPQVESDKISEKEVCVTPAVEESSKPTPIENIAVNKTEASNIEIGSNKTKEVIKGDLKLAPSKDSTNIPESIEIEESSDDDMIHDSFEQGNDDYAEDSNDDEASEELKNSEPTNISLITNEQSNISIKPDKIETKLLNTPVNKEDKTDFEETLTETPKLICVDITKLTTDSEGVEDTNEENPIKEPCIDAPKLEEPIKIDDDVVNIAETDPLALPDEEPEIVPSKEEEPAKGLSLATFKLDDTTDESIDTSALPAPIARALRNRKIALNVEPVKKQRKENSKAKPKLNETPGEDEASKTTSTETTPKTTKPQTARRGRGRNSGVARNREVTQSTPESNDNSTVIDCDAQSETPKSDVDKDEQSTNNEAGTEIIKTESGNEESAPPPVKEKSAKKKRSRMLGLDIDPSLIIEPKVGEEESATRSSLRQSRRIAQLRIREEAMQKADTLGMMHEFNKKKKKSKKDEDKDYKVDKKKKQSSSTDEDESDVEITEGKKKHKKKRKNQDLKKLFNMENPWQSSSNDSSTQNEEEDEDDVEEELTEDEVVLKSDHEFSPESDLENSSEVQPLRRARTVKKESDTEEPTDEHACQKCSKADHPEWILLCDKCDCGWHCSCLRPALLVIPEGDWFCPPCQHNALIEALKIQLTDYDKKINRLEMEVRRKERLAYVGIRLNNVLPSMKEQHSNDIPKERVREKEKQSDNSNSNSDDESSSSGSESNSEESSSDEDSEPIYQLRQRRQAQTYRFNDYDELINSAIQDEIEAVKGAGNQGRGKDIATIVNAEKEEAKALLENQDIKEEDEKPQVEQEHQISEHQTDVVIKPKPEEDVKEKEEPESEEESDDDLRVVPKHGSKKKHRKLNALDVSSEDDDAGDEDFKGTSDDDEEDFEDLGSEDSEDMEFLRRGKGRGGPTRRSTRARTQRYDRDFINDDSDAEEETTRKKKRSIWDETESEESDKDWGRRKRSKKQRNPSATRTVSKKSRKRKKRQDESDPEADVKRSFKKSRIKYGGLSDSDEEFLTRRTRGKKINYIDALGSDSDDDKQKSKRIIESEDEYVANEEDEDQEQDEPILDDDKDDSDSEEERHPNRPVKIPKGRGKAGIHRIIKSSDTSMPPMFMKKIEVETSDGVTKLTSSIPENIPVIAANPDNLNEEEVETMMMESEEYANKQLELMAIQLAKEKQRQANMQLLNKQEQVMPEVKQPKKRGRKRKVDIEAAALAAANAAAGIPNHAQAVPSIIVNAAGSQLDDMGRMSGLKDSDILPTTVIDLQTTPSKRRGRGKGRKTLEKEAAASGVDVMPPEHVKSVAVSGTIIPPASATAPMNAQIEQSNEPPGNISETSILAGKLGIAAPPQPFSQSQPTPSVITRMLQSQPISVQNFPPTGPNQMNQKYFPGMHDPPPRTAPPPQFPPMAPGRSRVPSPYRQASPNITIYPGMRPGPANSPHRLRPGGPPPPIQQLFHSTHHALDPSPSGGGPINITQAAREASSPQMITPPVSSPMAKDGPPPPPYNRAQIPVNRFSPGEGSPGPSIPSPIRHHMFPQSGTHLQQSSPPPRPPPPGGNFSPYHPPPPPNYHYGAYPPAPSLAAADDALPPTDYQGSPYPEPYNTTDGTIQSSEGSNSKPFNDEEGSGEFGGLVSYFSSQREDDLDT